MSSMLSTIEPVIIQRLETQGKISVSILCLIATKYLLNIILLVKTQQVTFHQLEISLQKQIQLNNNHINAIFKASDFYKEIELHNTILMIHA